MLIKLIYYIFSIFAIISASFGEGRSIWRKKDRSQVAISIRWKDTPELHHIVYNSHLEKSPLFTAFDHSYFMNHLIPDDPIPFLKNQSKAVFGKKLKELVEELILEINHNKKKYSHFTLLQKQSFHGKKKCGHLVFKFNDYPFVVKLFFETPKTFFDPYCKGGIETIAFFYMSGGTNRHILGFTRIPNLEYLKQYIKSDPYWSHYEYILPRKWYFLPKNGRWLELKGFNFEDTEDITTVIPATYGIIADYIDTREIRPINGNKKRNLVMKFCNDLQVVLDPHITNFSIEKVTTNSKKIRLKIIDTEHFPSLVGLKKVKKFRNYPSWIQYLMGKCIADMYFRPKSTRMYAQVKSVTPLLTADSLSLE